MTCDCGSRMGCIYSIPIGKTGVLRYRVYKCTECTLRQETVEMRVGQVGFDVDEIKELIKAGQDRRFFALKKFGKKGG